MGCSAVIKLKLYVRSFNESRVKKLANKPSAKHFRLCKIN